MKLIFSRLYLFSEPGYYKAGEFGIRIESIVEVMKAEIPDTEKDFCNFKTITMVPIQNKLICPEMLNQDEVKRFQLCNAVSSG